ncbi:hypothetical protein BDA99DRAFT_507313 [Phascolomyces articulosus]|uniref:F-box domain-containing protein n=1 Tax=Phascolomyces articulosus TaxID=60185 RepID=A0AAD5PER8_9FUNG|nr:hypothetical protein BDA99DRAFT_507313 [Phascolomyces articulosus]
MPLFKQAQDTILSRVSKIRDVSSKRLSTLILTTITTEDNNDDINKRRHRIAQEIIDKTPELAKGYLLSGQVYRDQNDLTSALSVYTQGLKIISPTTTTEEEALQQYTELQKEKHKLSERLIQRSQDGFLSLLPYDILYVIFGYLEFNDLLRCTFVCQQWRSFMLAWPEFWSIMSKKMPNLKQSTLVTLLYHKTSELCLEGPLDYGSVHGMLSFFSSWKENNSIQKLCLTNLTLLPTAEVQLLGDTVRCMSSSLRQIYLKDCYGKREDIIDYVMPACASSLKHVTFTHNFKRNHRDNDQERNEPLMWCRLSIHMILIQQQQQQHDDDQSSTMSSPCSPVENKQKMVLSPPTTPTTSNNNNTVLYPSLTYLKIDTLGRNVFLPLFQNPKQYVFDMPIYTLIRQCPNLTHLFLSTTITGLNTLKGILQAMKSCPRLVTLVVNEKGCMPDTTVTTIPSITPVTFTPFDSSNNDNNKNSNKKSIKIRLTPSITTSPITSLSHLVLSDYFNIEQEGQKRISELLKINHASLEYLHMDFDGWNVGPSVMNRLAILGCPRLREIRITSKTHPHSAKDNQPMAPILIKFFSACPCLESIQLFVQQGFRDDRTPYPQINASVLETMAQQCLRLKHLAILDYPTFYHQYVKRNFSGREDGAIRGENDVYSHQTYLCFANMGFNTDYSFFKNDGNSNNPDDDENWKKKKKKRTATLRGDEKRRSLIAATMMMKTTTKKKILESLTVYAMDPGTALTLVTNLESLKHLHILECCSYKNQKEIEDTDPVKNILQMRGGSLCIGGQYPPCSNPI